MLTGPGTTKGITYEKNQISNHFILIGSDPLKIANIGFGIFCESL